MTRVCNSHSGIQVTGVNSANADRSSGTQTHQFQREVLLVQVWLNVLAYTCSFRSPLAFSQMTVLLLIIPTTTWEKRKSSLAQVSQTVARVSLCLFFINWFSEHNNALPLCTYPRHISRDTSKPKMGASTKGPQTPSET